MASKYHTTHPETGQVKKVVPARADETPAQRHTRLTRQKAVNRVRVKARGGHVWQVPSQRKGTDGKPVATYTVHEYEGLGFSCDCVWGAGDATRGLPGHGLYVPGENDQAECAHIAAVVEHIARQDREVARQDREVARLARVMITRLAEQEASAA